MVTNEFVMYCEENNLTDKPLSEAWEIYNKAIADKEAAEKAEKERLERDDTARRTKIAETYMPGMFSKINWLFNEHNKWLDGDIVDFKKVSDVYQAYKSAIKLEQDRKFFNKTGVEILFPYGSDEDLYIRISGRYDFSSWRELLDLYDYYVIQQPLDELPQDQGIQRVCFEYAFALWSYYSSKGHFYEIFEKFIDGDRVCIKEINSLSYIKKNFKYPELYPTAEKILEYIDEGKIDEDILK